MIVLVEKSRDRARDGHRTIKLWLDKRSEKLCVSRKDAKHVLSEVEGHAKSGKKETFSLCALGGLARENFLN